MSMLNAFSEAFTAVCGGVKEGGLLIETSIRGLRKTAEGAEKYADAFKAEATLDCNKVLHRVKTQEIEFAKELKALEV